LLKVVVRNAHNAAEITDVCNEKITEYANRGFRALGISKAPGDGSQDVGGKPRWEMIGACCAVLCCAALHFEGRGGFGRGRVDVNGCLNTLLLPHDKHHPPNWQHPNWQHPNWQLAPRVSGGGTL
jgi:hypothetical protein